MAEPVSLMEVLSEVPDPRGAQGLRHPLPSILSLTVVAILAGMRGPESIAQFGRDHGARLAWALGFRRSRTPCKSTLSMLFRALDVEAFEAALRRWIAGRLALAPDDVPRVISIDGKRLRGSREGEAPGVHLLAAYAPQASAVLAQLRVGASTNEQRRPWNCSGSCRWRTRSSREMPSSASEMSARESQPVAANTSFPSRRIAGTAPPDCSQLWLGRAVFPPTFSESVPKRGEPPCPRRKDTAAWSAER